MIDINKDDPVYRPKPKRRLVANNTESVVAQCVQTVKTSARPDVHHVIEERDHAWDLITDSGTELKISGIPGLSIHFDRTRIIPRTFSAALASGKRMPLTEINFAHDLVPSTLRKWSADINTCNRWPDGYINDKCCVLRDLARDSGFD